MTVMNVSTIDVYRCPSCSELNLASENDFCLCTGEQSLVCASCGSCFCTASPSWKQAFWAKASAELIARRKSNRDATTGLSLIAQAPQRPVILLIDDDRIVHTIVTRVLAGFTGTLLHAYDGEEGIRIAREIHPELVLTDALMPKMDGREIARALKNDPDTATVKVVVITALYKGLRYRSEAFRDYLVDEYVEKPIRAEKLIEIIERMIGTKVNGATSVATFARG